MAKRNMGTGKSTGARGAADSIPNAELDILACLWREGPVTARRIRDMMKKYRPMAHGSVVTLLTRLETKGLVSKEKGAVGKAFLFRARNGPEQTHRRLTRDLLQRVFANNPAAMIGAVLDVEAPTAEEYAEIQKHVAAARGRVRKKPRIETAVR